MLANEVSQVKQTFKKAFFLGSMLLLQNLILVKLKFPTIHSHNCDYGFSLVIYHSWKFYCCNKKLPGSTRFWSCSHFVPPENNGKYLWFSGVFRGYKMGGHWPEIN